jgi:DNA modification methylase
MTPRTSYGVSLTALRDIPASFRARNPVSLRMRGARSYAAVVEREGIEAFRNRVFCADALELARKLPPRSLNCIVTSPPYWGARDYDTEGQLGLEETPEQFIENLVIIFRELRRALRDDGTLWLNLGDSFWHTRKTNGVSGGYGKQHIGRQDRSLRAGGKSHPQLKDKDLIGIPWRVAFALQADGWYLRMDIIWHKTNPMPESMSDRPTKAHEYVFLLSKSENYYYDADAIREPLQPKTYTTFGIDHKPQMNDGTGQVKSANWSDNVKTRKPKLKDDGTPAGANKKSVWRVGRENKDPDSKGHAAMFPKELIRPMILAGCPKGGVVLDPFMGAFTTAIVARELGRYFIGSEINPDYVTMGYDRLRMPFEKRQRELQSEPMEDLPLFAPRPTPAQPFGGEGTKRERNERAEEGSDVTRVVR